jgi:hypothetical protein
MTTGKQFFLIKLNSNHSKYKDQDWEALINHVKNHSGADGCWSTIRDLKHTGDLDFLSRTPPGISLGCTSFKSKLTVNKMYKLIEVSKEEE